MADGWRAGAAGAAALALMAGLSGCTGSVGITGGPTADTSGKPVRKPGGDRVRDARSDLRDLPVAAEGDDSGYDRDRFGQRWRDTDRNGCDQRNDVLARDLTGVRKRGGCVVVAGRLDDPYTGKQITFSKSDAAEVQIDHIYPLALAWRMGADEWPEERREEFANDKDNLLASWGVPNRQKSDSGPADWKPRKAYQCTYAVKYIAVAHEYRLAVTDADQAALEGFLDRC